MGDTETFLQAIKSGDVDAVKAKLAQNPSLTTARAESGESPLLLARYFGKDAIVQVLLEIGPEPNIYEAAALGQAERVATLVEQSSAEINTFSGDGFTPLQLASYFGYPEIVEFLLQNGADVSPASRNPMGVTALHAALASRPAESRDRSARVLIAGGADVNARQQGGFTPLHETAQNDDVALTHLLLD